jgi:glycosyltransferase involved in cell wall biosynthesis
MDVSVVIPAFNAESTIGEQLEALAQQDFERDWEIVVVDNASTDGTPQILEHWCGRLPNLRIVDEPERGVNRARNAGVEAAQADRVLLCDADDVVDISWVRALDAALDEFDVAAGRLEYSKLNSQEVEARSSYRPLSTGLATLWNRRWGMTCNLGFRRRVFDAIDGFDPSFERGGSDDVDFCFRAGSAGFSLGFAPDALVHYRRRVEYKQHARQMFHYAKGSEHLYRKYRELGELDDFPPRTRLNLSLVRAVHLIRSAPKVRTRTGREIYAARAAQFAGGLAGIWEWQVRQRDLVGRARTTAAKATTFLSPKGTATRRRIEPGATTEPTAVAPRRDDVGTSEPVRIDRRFGRVPEADVARSAS